MDPNNLPPNIIATNIAPAAATPSQVTDVTGGVQDGAVEKRDHPSEPVRANIDHYEQVVHEKDQDGNVIGFHKVHLDECPCQQGAPNNG